MAHSNDETALGNPFLKESGSKSFACQRILKMVTQVPEQQNLPMLIYKPIDVFNLFKDCQRSHCQLHSPIEKIIDKTEANYRIIFQKSAEK